LLQIARASLGEFPFGIYQNLFWYVM